MICTVMWNRTARSRRWGGSLIGALLMVLACAGAHAADDDPPGRVGRVIESQGTSWLYDTDADEWVELQRNRPITSGNRVAVDGAARIDLRVGSTSIRLAGGSELEVRRLDDERIDLHLLTGSAALRVRSLEVAREIEITTADGRFTPRQPGHYRIDFQAGASSATAWSGELHFENDDSALDIAAGRSAGFWREANVTHHDWREPDSDEFADWVARANREDDRNGVTRYVSPEMTGHEDLDRYGRWDQDPDYGALWTPTTVVSGWSPYRYGHWTWISPWGWTWVDDAPWGFAPFHYGRWVVVGGRWCWAPGRYVRRPVYAPALVAWVGHGERVRPGPPLVGWVPLAPREAYYPRYRHDVHHWRSVNRAHLHLFAPDTPRTVPTQPTRYANQAAPGGLSLLPAAALVSRRPVAPVVVQPNPALRSGGDLAQRSWRPAAPPTGPARINPLPRDRAVPPAPRSDAPIVRTPRTVVPPLPQAMPPRDRVPRAMTPPRGGDEPARATIPQPQQPMQRVPPVPRMQPLPAPQQVPPPQVQPPQVQPPRAQPPQTQPAPIAPRRFEPMQRERREPAGRGAQSHAPAVAMPAQRPLPVPHAAPPMARHPQAAHRPAPEARVRVPERQGHMPRHQAR